MTLSLGLEPREQEFSGRTSYHMTYFSLYLTCTLVYEATVLGQQSTVETLVNNRC
jgi:hypothetical protein